MALALFAIYVGLLASCQSGAETPSTVNTDASTGGATQTPIATETSALLPTLTSIPRNTPTPFPVPTPADPNLRHMELKQLVVDIINTRRASRSLPPLEIEVDAQVQIHTEQSLESCTFGPWATDGLSIQMKYSLAGGYQARQLLGYGLNYCVTQSEEGQAEANPADKLTAIANFLVDDPRRNPFLDHLYDRIGIGIAYDDFNLRMYTMLSGDYVHFDGLPKMENGELSIFGTTKGQVRFARPDQLTVQILYEPPPEPLTAGQLARTSCL